MICVDDWYAEREDDGTSVFAALADGLLQQSDLAAIASVSPILELLHDPAVSPALAVDEVQKAWGSLDATVRKE